MKCVRIGNEMVAKLILLVFLWVSKGIFFVVEPPKGSLMESHPRFVQFTRKFAVFRKFVATRDYGAETEKGSWLYSAHACIHDIDKYREPNTNASNTSLVNKYVCAKERAR